MSTDSQPTRLTTLIVDATHTLHTSVEPPAHSTTHDHCYVTLSTLLTGPYLQRERQQAVCCAADVARAFVCFTRSSAVTCASEPQPQSTPRRSAALAVHCRKVLRVCDEY